MSRTLLPFLALPLLALTLPSVPGIEMTTRSTHLRDGTSWTNTATVSGGNLHMDVGHPEGSNAGSLVYLAESSELIMNQARDRSYIRTSKADAEAMGSMMGDAMGAAAQAMAALSPEQRKMIEEAGGLPGAGAAMGSNRVAELRETGETGTRAGYDATRFDLYMNGMLMQQIWYADWSEVEGSGQLRQAFEGVASVWQSFIDAMGSAPFGGFNALEDAGRGVPVFTVSIDEEGNPEVETVLESVNEVDVDPAIFAPQDGYRETPMPRLGG